MSEGKKTLVIYKYSTMLELPVFISAFLLADLELNSSNSGANSELRTGSELRHR